VENIFLIIKQVISGIRNEVLLFAGLFGLIVVLIGMHNIEVVKTLRWPLFLVFVMGLTGFIMVRVLRPERPQIEVWLDKEVLPNRTWTSKVFEKLTGDEKSLKILAISAATTISNISLKNRLAALRTADIKWLLLDPNPEGIGILSRVKENPTRNAEGLCNHIRSSLSLICKTKCDNDHKNFEVRLYNEHPVIRLIIVDDTAYFSYYPKGPAYDISVYVLKRGQAWLFDALEKYYDTLWSRSIEYKCPTITETTKS
jgi:hypothetical protein